MEIVISTEMSPYSGGLGILAGDATPRGPHQAELLGRADLLPDEEVRVRP
jgi:hypothetical protein